MPQKIVSISKEILTRPEVMDLSTVDGEGYPQTRGIANLRHNRLYSHLQDFFISEPDFRVYIPTHSRSEKVKHIRGNDKISAYFIWPETFHSFLLSGTAVRVMEKRIKEILWQKGWEQFYPDGPLGRSFAIFQLDPIQAKGWNVDKSFAFKLPV